MMLDCSLREDLNAIHVMSVQGQFSRKHQLFGLQGFLTVVGINTTCE